MADNVAQSLLNLLKVNGVKYLYGVTGDTVFPLFNSLSEFKDIQFIATSNEVNAAFMASYQAKLTKKIGVCIATSGPGIANLINGLADAYFDKAAVLAITGQVPLNKIGTGAKQYLNQQKLLQAVTYSSELITSSETAVPVVTKALENAINKKTVTHVSIPEDIFLQDIKTEFPLIDTRALKRNISGFSGDYKGALSLLKEANNPLLVIGVGDKHLQEDFKNLAEILKAAIIITQKAKGIIPSEHPQVIGGIGEAYLPSILNEVDLIIQFGLASFEKNFLPSVNTIQIVEDKGSIDYKRANLVLKGNIIDLLKAFLNDLYPKEEQYWEGKIAEEKSNFNNMINEQRENKTNPIFPAHLMTVLNKYIPEDAIIVCDIGAFAHWFDTYFQAKNQTILMSSNWRSMGSSLAGALSSALNYKDKKVISLIGDGGLLISLNELATVVKYKLPLTIIVVNNHLYEIEKLKMEKKNFVPFGVDVSPLDFAALAKGFGAEGIRVDKAEDLSSLVEKSINIEGPVVLDVQVAQTQLPFIK